MALRLNCTKNFFGKDVTYENAYLRVNSFQGTKEGVSFQASIYTDSSKNIEIEKLPNHYCSINVEQPIIQQCYEYLKSREEYQDAEDC